MRRVLIAAAVLALGSSVSVASPAQAAYRAWVSVSAGTSHTCGIDSAKSLHCWGDNLFGKIGDGTGDSRLSPTRIGSSGVWVTVSAGADHTCAISTGKYLYCWGDNINGQLGDGTTEVRLVPKRIGLGSWASVSAGERHTCAVSSGNSLYCWGSNLYGQIGDGTGDNTRLSPKKIGSSGVWSAVTTGSEHTCATTVGKYKALYCWGHNTRGQLGDGTTDQRESPKRIGSGLWFQVSAGNDQTCAVSASRSLYCWGWNEEGQVGDGTTDQRNSPKKIGTSGVWGQVKAGGSGAHAHTCAISTGKTLYCWGSNNFGQIGDGTTGTDRLSPKKIGSTGVWATTTAGRDQTCAISTGSALYCWGTNNKGQLGDGTMTNRLTPRRII